MKDIKDWFVSDEIFRNYINSCIDAATKEDIFNNFKRDPRYTNVLEHTTYDESLIYWEYIEKNSKKILDKIELLKENDLYGNPVFYQYTIEDKKINISPSTIRYIKNSLDILNKFGNGIETIVEIGGGYGGLCKTLSSFYDFDSYHILDIKEANKLSIKYLSLFNLNKKVRCSTLDEYNSGNGMDLLISNYAFSELSKKVQKEYIDKVIKKSNFFYIIDNNLSIELHNDPGFSFDELKEELKDYDIEVEKEISYENKIYYGKKK